MSVKQAMAEVFWTAFRSLPKSQREAVVGRLVKDSEFAEDLEDILLIEKSRREKGKDIPIDEYLSARKKNG